MWKITIPLFTSLQCSRYNSSSMSNSRDMRASEDTQLCVLVSCSASFSFKIQTCCFKNSLCFSISSGDLMAAFTQLESTLPHYCSIILFFQTKAVVTSFTRRKQCLYDLNKFNCFTNVLLHSIPESTEIEAKETGLQKKVLKLMNYIWWITRTCH